jgi:glycosyltransferase involved in cell wall biosynthesis
MPDVPYFTIVVATFNRSRHIVPTIEAALEQTFTDFELLVVGDGLTDDTLDHVPRNDARVGVIGLPWNSGSQARPNNVGIAAARGQHIAYLGHDDIWMPDHLAALVQLFEETECDIAVSGCAYHGPPGTDLIQITGLFEDPKEARRHFFPPTSLAHRRSLAIQIGGWRAPHTLTSPDDWDFLLRAADAGARFASTGRVTAQKFAAGHRYLSYLDQSSSEQREMLTAIQSGAVDRQICAQYVERAKAAGTFMNDRDHDFAVFQPGHLYRMNRFNKGIERAATVPLTEELHILPSSEPRALDWYALEQTTDGSPFRRSGPSLRPRLLIPFAGDIEARITLHLLDQDPKGIDRIRLTLNGDAIEHRTRRNPPDRVDLDLIGRLRREKPSVLQLILPESLCPAEIDGAPDRRRLGVALLGFTVSPVRSNRVLLWIRRVISCA